jgi:gliding motility-associated-like protein
MSPPAGLDRTLGMMTKTPIYLIVLHSFILVSHAVLGQCGYKVAIQTNHDYCVGSSLIATSAHALQKITWYRNGQPVSTVTGVQSLATQLTKIPVLLTEPQHSDYGDVRISSDDAGNRYIMYDFDLVLKITPQGVASQLVSFINDPTDQSSISGIFADPGGDVYISSANDLFDANATALVWKVPAGTVSAQPADLPVVMPLTAIPNDSTPASAVFVDCHNNISIIDFLGSSDNGNIYRYATGAATATLIEANSGSWAGCTSGYFGYGQIRIDPAGNTFFLDGDYVKEIAAGGAASAIVVPASCNGNYSRAISDFWLDANDTIYLAGCNRSENTSFVEKWAPGAATGQPLLSFPLPKGVTGFVPIDMDVRGNILLGYDMAPSLYECKRTTSIDSSFTPTDTGAYYAVVTDIRGYTTTSDTFHINSPSAGPPSIQITATADTTPVCTPVTFTAAVANPGPGPSYQWMVSGVPVGGDSTTYSNNLFADGDEVYCILMAQDGCQGPVADTSNMVRMGINPEGAASVTIAASPRTSICAGQTISFAATVMNGSANPVFEWLVNGDSTGDDSSTFTRSNFSNEDVVTCLITSDDACGLAKSNSIPLIVSIPPVIEPGQIFTIPQGGSLQLDPVISGTVNTWAWSPGSWLSDSSIADPVADPPATITYTLMVEANGGCGDTATILVDVFTPLVLPNAFTPNGDGRNDRFYVLGGPVNSVVETFDVFNRWGQAVFRVHDVAPGDASVGWDGRVNGSFVPPGTYVYVVVMRFATGSRQMYKGTVEVIR